MKKCNGSRNGNSSMTLFQQFISLIFLSICTACTGDVTNVYPEAQQSLAPDQPTKLGTINGGGGKGVRCHKNGIATVETLDIYEAKVLYGFKMIQVPNNKDQALEILANTFAEHFWNILTIPMDEFRLNLKKMFYQHLEDIRFVQTGGLYSTQDSFEPLVEKGCEIVQLAVYYDESVLIVDETLWNQLDWLSRIALLAHELVYLSSRVQSGASNSVSTRKGIGKLFSTTGLRPKTDNVPDDREKVAECGLSYNGGQFGNALAFDSKDEFGREGVEFVFTYLPNLATEMFRTSAFISHLNLELLFNESSGGFTEADLNVDSYPTTKALLFKKTGQGYGTLQILDRATSALSREYEVQCSMLAP